MNVDEAINSLELICSDERGQFCYMDKDDLYEIVAVLRAHVERKVDDAMVQIRVLPSRQALDECLKKIHKAATNHSPYECGLPMYDLTFMDTARDALIAALGVEGA